MFRQRLKVSLNSLRGLTEEALAVPAFFPRSLQETCCRKLGRAPQTLFFSATLRSPLAVEAIAALAPNASWVDLRGKETLPDATKVCVYSVDPRQVRASESAALSSPRRDRH